MCAKLQLLKVFLFSDKLPVFYDTVEHCINNCICFPKFIALSKNYSKRIN